MKNKLFLVALTLGSTLATASQMPNPLLERQFVSGYVLPRYRRQSDCKLYPKAHQMYPAMVIINEKKGEHLSPQPMIMRQIRWTPEVPHEGAIRKLVKEAKAEDGNKTQLQLPADISAIRHSAIETVGAGAPKYWVLRWQDSNARGEENPSDAAKTLVKFLETNCK